MNLSHFKGIEELTISFLNSRFSVVKQPEITLVDIEVCL